MCAVTPHAERFCTLCVTVYLLDELVADAQSGMPEVGLMVEFCVKRLSAKPPVVKQKVRNILDAAEGDTDAAG